MNKTVAYVLQKENNNFDLLRLLAALMVIYAHSYPLAYSEGHKDIFLSLTKGFADGGSIAVKFFFFLSGILVTHSLLKSGNIKRFVIARFFRIYPAFIFVILMGALVIAPIVSTLSWNEYIRHEMVWDYIRHGARFHIEFVLPGVFEQNIYKNAVNGSLWTIPFEVGAYALLLASYILAGETKKRLVLTIIFLSIIILPIFNVGNGLFVAKDNFAVSMLPACFALGGLWAIYQDKIEVSLKYPLAFLIICYVASDDYLRHMMFFFFVVTLLLYLGSTAWIQKIKVKYDVSYGVYLWGFIVQQMVYFYFPNLNLFVNQWVCMIMTLLLAIPTFVLIEKPAMNFGRKLSQKFN